MRRPGATDGTGRNHFNGADFRRQQPPRSRKNLRHAVIRRDPLVLLLVLFFLLAARVSARVSKKTQVTVS